MTTESLTITCPAWCTDADSADRAFDDEGDRLHKGPLFGGLLRGWGSESGARPLQVSVDVEQTDDFTTPDQLRALARAAHEAARWLEEARS